MAMLVYDYSLATAATVTTNGTINTETDVVDFLANATIRNFNLLSFYVGGKAGGLTAISGLAFRFCRFSTGSTSGTTITPTPCDPGAQAAKSTIKSAPTAGSTRTNGVIVSCGAAGPGGWVAPNPDAVETLQSAGTGTLDVMSVSATVSLGFEFSGQIAE